MSGTQPPAEIIVYTLPWCMHCARAKALLKRRGLSFREIDGSPIPNFRQRLAERTAGATVPQIVIDGTPIGGADRLAALDRLGVLGAIARGERFPIARDLPQVSSRSIVRWAAARVRGRRDVSPVRRTQVTLDRAGRVVEPTSESSPNEGGR